jgi:MoaA/NifB/PqqE/SkfB family radical SAM enzyme
MKTFSPRDMYFSPQCIRYGHKSNQTFVVNSHDQPAEGSESAGLSDDPKSLFSSPPSEWLHWCMGGKTFAYIAADGVVQLCAGISAECGNLRDVGYDFGKIWERSSLMQNVREYDWSCTETREQLTRRSDTRAEVNNEPAEPPISQGNIS